MDQLLPLMKKYKWQLTVAPFVLLIMLQLYYFFQIAWWVNFNPSSTSFMRELLSVLQKKSECAASA